LDQADNASHRIAYLACVACAVALGLWLRADALGGTLLADDYDHYAMRAGIYPVARGPLDLFNFVSADPLERQALMRAGRLPWWSDSKLELSVFRPLASALVSLDYAVLGGVPYRMHFHSMLWWVVLMLGVARLFYSVLPLPIAGLALLLYACDEAHGVPVAWIANRSALIAIAFVVWGLWAHVMLRTRGLRGGQVLSLACVALGLLAGEHAVGALAYFVSFEIFAARDAPGRRVRALAPVAALCTLYAGLHQWLGYGVAGSGFYIDPIRQPLRYLTACAERLPLLVGDITLGLGAEWHFGDPPFRLWLNDSGALPKSWLSFENLHGAQFTLGALAVVASLALTVWLWRSASTVRLQGVALRWLWPGALLSLIPMCSTVPMSRLTVGAAIGADAMIALIVVAAVHTTFGASRVLPKIAGGALAASLLWVHGAYASVRTRDNVKGWADHSQAEARWVRQAQLDDTRVAGQKVFVIAAADWLSQAALPFLRHSQGRSVPLGSYLLSGGFAQAHMLDRVSDRVLDVYMLGTGMDGTFSGSAYRGSENPFRGGERVSLPEFSVQVVSVSRDQPSCLRVTFKKSVDDPGYVFLYAYKTGLGQPRMPSVGTSISLPHPSLPHFDAR
jgi:hypothetical protein